MTRDQLFFYSGCLISCIVTLVHYYRTNHDDRKGVSPRYPLFVKATLTASMSGIVFGCLYATSSAYVFLKEHETLDTFKYTARCTNQNTNQTSSMSLSFYIA
jgi:hypothetical protein